MDFLNHPLIAALKMLQEKYRKPIVVSNPNDPRLKAYRDSLALYNKNKTIYDKEKPANATYKDVTDFVPYGQKVYTPKGAPFGSYKKPEQPVVFHTEKRDYGDDDSKWKIVAQEPGMTLRENLVTIKPPTTIVRRTPLVVPEKIPIRLAPTNVAPVPPPPPTPQLVPVAQPPAVPLAKPSGAAPAIWGPGAIYSLKDEKVRKMLNALVKLKK